MSTSAIRIEPMRAEDVDEVLAIERVSFTNPWSRNAFLYELRENRVAHLWVARGREAAEGATPPRSPDVVGYLCLWAIADEIHITNFAVHPTHRRRGIGRQFLGGLLDHYRARGATRVALEVRPSNLEARRLYEAFGFRQVGLRKGYYFDTGEDALVLEARLADTPASPGPRSGTRASGDAFPR